MKKKVYMKNPNAIAMDDPYNARDTFEKQKGRKTRLLKKFPEILYSPLELPKMI